MHWLYKFPFRLRSLFQKSRVEKELSGQLCFHLERLIEEKVARGMIPEEARSAALREPGGVEQMKEKCRDSWGVRFREEVAQDIRYGLRQLRGDPAVLDDNRLILNERRSRAVNHQHVRQGDHGRIDAHELLHEG